MKINCSERRAGLVVLANDRTVYWHRRQSPRAQTAQQVFKHFVNLVMRRHRDYVKIQLEAAKKPVAGNYLCGSGYISVYYSHASGGCRPHKPPAVSICLENTRTWPRGLQKN